MQEQGEAGPEKTGEERLGGSTHGSVLPEPLQAAEVLKKRKE